MPEVNILANVNQFIKDELAKGTVPADAKLALVGTVDNHGGRIVAAVKIKQTEKLNVSVAAVFDHEWHGDTKVAGNVVLYFK